MNVVATRPISMRASRRSCWPPSIAGWSAKCGQSSRSTITRIAGPARSSTQMQELGLFGATIGAEYGGLGLPATTYAEIVMRISAVWMAITGIFNSHLMLALAIEKFGTEPQKQRWLPALASGDIRGGLALTEPDAGTDLQGIRMTARRERRSTTSSTAPRPGSPTASKAPASRCWSRPIRRPSRATRA